MTYGLAQWVYTYRGYEVHGHTGGDQGQVSVILRIPSKGLAVMMAVNDDVFGVPLYEIVGNRILDHLLDLEPIDWEGRVMEDFLGNLPDQVLPPTHPRAPPSEEQVVGTYFDAGYGNMTLKPTTLASLPVPIRIHPADDGPIYVAEMDKVFVSHVVFTHFDGPLFNFTAMQVSPALDPQGRKTDKYMSSERSAGSVVVTQDGMGMFGGWWGQGRSLAGVEAREENVKERAEVWFEKLDGC